MNILAINFNGQLVELELCFARTNVVTKLEFDNEVEPFGSSNIIGIIHSQNPNKTSPFILGQAVCHVVELKQRYQTS